jgi:hypothetical protein
MKRSCLSWPCGVCVMGWVASLSRYRGPGGRAAEGHDIRGFVANEREASDPNLRAAIMSRSARTRRCRCRRMMFVVNSDQWSPRRIGPNCPCRAVSPVWWPAWPVAAAGRRKQAQQHLDAPVLASPLHLRADVQGKSDPSRRYWQYDRGKNDGVGLLRHFSVRGRMWIQVRGAPDWLSWAGTNLRPDPRNGGQGRC